MGHGFSIQNRPDPRASSTRRSHIVSAICTTVVEVSKRSFLLCRYCKNNSEHSQRSGSSSQSCSDRQEHQVQPAIQHSCVRSGGH